MTTTPMNTTMTHDCKTCPVKDGTHKPAEAVHEIAEPKTQQPDVLRLADWLNQGGWPSYVPQEAAAELRRQHARIADLEAQLDAIGAGGVEPLRKPAAAQQAVQAKVPEGWKRVPIEPTAAMVEAIMSEGEVDAINRLAPCLRPIFLERAGIVSRYTAMLAAAPAHPAEGVPEQAAKLPPLPEPTAFLVCKGSEVTARAWNVDQMRSYAAAALAATQPAAQGIDALLANVARKVVSELADSPVSAFKTLQRAVDDCAALAAQAKQGGAA